MGRDGVLNEREKKQGGLGLQLPRPKHRKLALQVPWREVLRYGLYFLGTGLLCALPTGDAPSPLAACVAAACSGGALAASFLGCCAGYCLLWPVADGVWPLILAAVLPAAAWLLRKSRYQAVAWYLPAVHTVAAAAVGFGMLWQMQFPPAALGRYFSSLVSVFAGSWVSRLALLEQRRWARLLLGATLLAALSGFSLAGWFHPGLAVGLFLTAVTAAAPEGLAVAAAAGIVLETCSGMHLPFTALFCLCSGAGYLVRHLTVFHRSLAVLLLSAAFAWLLGQTAAQMCLLSAAAASIAALAVPRLRLLPHASGAAEEKRLGAQLQMASDALLRLHDTVLAPAVMEDTDPDAAEIFDRATEAVCKDCPGWRTCWERESGDTYHALCCAAGPMLAQYRATPEDFPPSFCTRCQQLDAFLQAVNRQLDGILYRRQYRARQQESRRMLRDQYLLLARYLQGAADAGLCGVEGEAQYNPEIAARAVGKRGQALSGDRGACFHGPGTTFFVLLCDGMGTGRGAKAESSSAMEALTGLLRAGLDAASALQLLNSAYVLRDDGRFATVDLLQIDLASGNALLLKWGAAPSYLRHDGVLRRLGEASMPPGLALAGLDKAQRIKLTLRPGDLIVLTSDGAGVEETERCIAARAERPVAELAAGIVDAAAPGDDITVVVLRLQAPAA